MSLRTDLNDVLHICVYRSRFRTALVINNVAGTSCFGKILIPIRRVTGRLYRDNNSTVASGSPILNSDLMNVVASTVIVACKRAILNASHLISRIASRLGSRTAISIGVVAIGIR